MSDLYFVYDGLSRLRISRYYTKQGNGQLALINETRRVYDGMDVVQERNQYNVVTASYTRTGNIGGILARTTQAGSTFYGYDGAGNVVTLTNSSGAEVGSYTYDAFGNIVAQSGAMANENPYRFSTKEQIGGLYSYGFRFYSPGIGRFINRDPIGEAGGTNLYGFVGNDPVNGVDAYGLVGAGVYYEVESSVGVAFGQIPAKGIPASGLGVGGATSTSGGAGLFAPIDNISLDSATGGAFASSGGFARYGNKSLFSTTPAGHREGVFGADAGGGLGLFFTNANNAGELKDTTDTINLNGSTKWFGGWKAGVSYSWGRQKSGRLIGQLSINGGAEFGPGSFTKYGTTTFPARSVPFRQLPSWGLGKLNDAKNFCKKVGIL